MEVRHIVFQHRFGAERNAVFAMNRRAYSLQIFLEQTVHISMMLVLGCLKNGQHG